MNQSLRDNASDTALLAAVSAAAESVVRRELGGCEIAQVWSEPHCILFRLADGRTGSIEVQVSWDVVPVAKLEAKAWPQPVNGRIENTERIIEAIPAALPTKPATVLTDMDLQRIQETVGATIRAELASGNNNGRYWSPERAAKECTISERTFADWMSDGKVRYYKVGRRVMLDPQELKEDLTKFRRQRIPKRRKHRM